MAAGKNTGIQIGLIICALFMVIFGVVAYLMWKDTSELRAQLETQKSELNNSQNASRNYLDQLDALKKQLGATFDNVGQAGSQDPNTVIGFVNSKMAEMAGPAAQPTVVETLTRMRAELNARDQTIAQLQNSENKINQEMIALTTVYNKMAEEHDEAAKDAEKDLQGQITEKKEAIDGINKQLDEERQKNTELQIAYEKLREEFDNTKDDLENQISKLTETNTRLSDQIYEMTDQSFDIPDGEIVSVNFDTNPPSVHINLGREDKLKTGTMFSVYQKNLATVGGRTSDIKATIQVVRVIGPHQAVAKITSEGDYPGDYSRPIARGDAVFSPLWRAGVQEVFALVGKFDLDGDKTDDRNILINMIRNAGGAVEAQVLPDGERTGSEIDSHFKFLVLGDIGDPAKEPDEQGRAIIQKVHSHTNDMKKEAKQSGVRTVTKNDFLSYMGYKPQRRLWRPGENIPWVMTTRRDAGRSTKDIESRGTVSGAYSRSNRDVTSPR